jgi:hypothetical protein
MAVRYHSEDEEVRLLIDATLDRLPFKVATFAHENMTFLSVGRGRDGQTLPARYLKPVYKGSPHWLTLLDANLVDLDEESALFIIAHEIAHAYGNHAHEPDKEAKADAQAEEWGFRKSIP